MDRHTMERRSASGRTRSPGRTTRGSIPSCSRAGVKSAAPRRGNRRGAMVTDRYQHVRHHPTLDAFAQWAAAADLPVLGIDNLPGAEPIDAYPLPERCALLFGQEGPGLSAAAREFVTAILAIRQFGSTRSINAAAASAIAMHEWVRRHHRP